MAFLQSATLLNMGADAVKTAAANPVSPPAVNSNTDAFALALRKQMQQNSKPATPASQQANARPSEPASKPAAPTDTAQAATTNTNAGAVDTDADDKPIASDQDSLAMVDTTENLEMMPDVATDTVVKVDTAQVETAQERKKRLLAELATNEPLPSGITPWMQSMIAMRPVAPTSEPPTKTEFSAAMSALPADSEQLTGLDASALSLNTAVTEKPDLLQAPVEPSIHEDAQDPSVDFKQLLAGHAQAGTDTALAGVSETVANAKLVAEATALNGRPQASNEARGSNPQADALNMVSQPAAQALSNSPWLSAAGIAQSSSVMTAQLATPFGNERWQTAMNQHVMNMISSGDEVASLTLSPPDLGPIQVVLAVDNQSVNTSFITDNPVVRQALEDGMQDLRDRMQSQGLQLGQTFVGDGQQAQQHFEQQSTPRQRGQSIGSHETTEPLLAAQAVQTSVHRGLVDTFV